MLLKQALYIGENFEKCLGDYLNETGHLDSNFKVDPFIGSKILCRIMINIHLGVKFYSLDYAFKYFNLTESELTCMRSKIGEPEYVEKSLISDLYNRSTKMHKSEIKAKIALLDAWFDSYITENYYHCRNLDIEHRFFNHIFEKSASSSNNFIDDEWKSLKEFCFKHYIRKKQLLQSDFDLATRSYEIKGEYLDFCYYQVIEPYKRFVIASVYWNFIKLDEFGASKQICIIDLVEKYLVIEKLMAVSVAAAYGMSDDQRKVELKHFDRIYRKLYRDLDSYCRNNNLVYDQ